MCRTDGAFWKFNSHIILNNLEANVHVKVMNSILFRVSPAYFYFMVHLFHYRVAVLTENMGLMITLWTLLGMQ